MIACATIAAKGIGFFVAWALEHPRCAAARRFVASRASLRPLLEFSHDWATHAATEGAIVAIEAAALAAVKAATSPALSRRVILAAAVLDTAFVIGRLRRIAAPLAPAGLPARRLSRLLPLFTPRFGLVVGAVHGVRAAIRTAVGIALRHFIKDDTYLRPQGVIVQALGHGVVSGVTVAVAAGATAMALHRPPQPTGTGSATQGGGKVGSSGQFPLLVWELAFGAAFAVSSVVGDRFTTAVNARCDAAVRRWLYRPLPGPRNSRQRVFDLKELDERFGGLSATELSEVSQFANEALRSTSIDHNTRLHAVRFLAAITGYVEAVNNGVLSRPVHVPSSQSITYTKPRGANGAGGGASRPSTPASPSATLESPVGPLPSSPAQQPLTPVTLPATPPTEFATHVFTTEQIAERLSAKGEPFACAKSGKPFKAGDKAFILPCGHLLGTTAKLRSDWCPTCVRPTHSPSNEERMKVFIGMKAFVERLAEEWNTTEIIPPRLHYVEWTYVAQYARRRRSVEGDAPLDVVPPLFVPGVMAILDLPLAALVWGLRVGPTESPVSIFTAKGGW